ncbi:hypothetical protein L2E82_02123 [Cichorium intybus]|uniref:Uncharacterized protein n=1 Tax=Cichorium intybus TaxID=13427 RepID=A0ACB9H0S6_CICIN|nr:hypothetical protein L2E82_02123 [Cichorium intybus]
MVSKKSPSIGPYEAVEHEGESEARSSEDRSHFVGGYEAHLKSLWSLGNKKQRRNLLQKEEVGVRERGSGGRNLLQKEEKRVDSGFGLIDGDFKRRRRRMEATMDEEVEETLA